NQNPIYTQVFALDDYAPRDNFGTRVTDSNDARLAFYLMPDDRLSNPNALPIETLSGFWNTATSSIPAYLPGEMALIRAEANAMMGNITGAIAEIDAIRTKTPDRDPFGIGASLPPYSGPQTVEAVTEEIFRQRRAELFLSGTGLEDSRRLGQPGPSSNPFERNRNFYPYADQERLNNPNTPSDPTN
ncbi:MAG: RagB/SusD family nutrient uptake outer membrane protein, partial [Gemmatimonadota bacterium]|nr:RagB/SusD family nutrient uptake outer membrane protein [Gemmatimonadota bacterium]